MAKNLNSYCPNCNEKMHKCQHRVYGKIYICDPYGYWSNTKTRHIKDFLVAFLFCLMTVTSAKAFTATIDFRFDLNADAEQTAIIREGPCNNVLPSWEAISITHDTPALPDGVYCYSIDGYGDFVQEDQYHIGPITVITDPFVVTERFLVRSVI